MPPSLLYFGIEESRILELLELSLAATKKRALHIVIWDASDVFTSAIIGSIHDSEIWLRLLSVGTHAGGVRPEDLSVGCLACTLLSLKEHLTRQPMAVGRQYHRWLSPWVEKQPSLMLIAVAIHAEFFIICVNLKGEKHTRGEVSSKKYAFKDHRGGFSVEYETHRSVRWVTLKWAMVTVTIKFCRCASGQKHRGRLTSGRRVKFWLAMLILRRWM